ncbi:hypothetical protein AB0I85_26065 [Micromonospora echinofusca]|uniref:hypothetical protein n=1 Tax=Micromonospora echinofusca TaxID=47858 RepID=UPI000C714914
MGTERYVVDAPAVDVDDANAVECAYDDASASGPAPLTWAQRFMWDVIAAAGVAPEAFDLLLVHDLAVPVTPDEALGVVRDFLRRHPVLRTSISRTGQGTPVQSVRASARVRVPLAHGVEADFERQRDLVPGTTEAQLCRPLFALDRDRVVRVAMRISHLATDAGGLRLLTDDLAASFVGRQGVDGPVETPSPVDRARFENGPDGVEVQRRAVDVAARIYAEASPTMWPRPRRRPEPERFWYGQLRSFDLLAAMEALTRQRRLRRIGILTGALATVSATVAGLPAALLFTISSNRFDAAWRGYPGPLSQEAILHLPVRDDVTETMRSAMALTMRSLQSAAYAPEAMEATRRAAQWRRGVCFDAVGSAIVLNLLADEPGVPGATVTPVPTTFTWTGTTNAENLGLYLDAQQTATEFVLGARVDTSLMAPGEAEAWLRTMEWAIVSSVAGDVGVADVRAYLRGHGVRCGTDRGDNLELSLSGCERVVAEATGARAVRVRRHDPDGTGTLCYLAGPRLVGTPREAHVAVMAALPAAQPAVAPSTYVIVAEPPADPCDDEAWSRLPVLSRGDGRERTADAGQE